LSYSKKISDKGKTFYDVINNGIRIGMVEFHSVANKYIEIDRIYLDENQQKKGFGQKIIYDILAHTNSNGFILYPLEQSVWVKMGLSFIEGKYPYMIISKKDFINKNSKKL
jgi:predicted GNAT family acetyltransferase